MKPDQTRYYEFTRSLASNERQRAAQLPPGPDREDAKGWARDLLGHARKLRVGR